MIRKRPLAYVVVTLGLFLVLRLCCLRGLIAPVRVSGGSMAASVYGEHYAFECEDCSFPFRCGVDQEPATYFAVCPNCGYDRNSLAEARPRKGRRVLLDRVAYLYRRPQRWELVAFHDETGRLSVKRVVAFPHEQVAIRDGDLYIHGRIHRKSFEHQRQLAILVHDNDYRPAKEASVPPRWNAERDDTKWRVGNRSYTFAADRRDSVDENSSIEFTAFDWLTYRHWRCYAGPASRTDESPVVDNYGYNQAVSRELRKVTDVWLSCELTISKQARLAFLAHDGREPFYVVLEAEKGRVTAWRDGQLVGEVPRRLAARGPHRIEVGLSDQQLVLAIDERVALEAAYQPDERPRQPTSRPLGIGAAGGTISIRQLKVYRDIYLLDPGGIGLRWAMERPLADDAYWVLGDNSPISRDSRHWTVQGLSHKRLLGRVLRPFR